jgi:hypothetical protein
LRCPGRASVWTNGQRERGSSSTHAWMASPPMARPCSWSTPRAVTYPSSDIEMSAITLLCSLLQGLLSAHPTRVVQRVRSGLRRGAVQVHNGGAGWNGEENSTVPLGAVGVRFRVGSAERRFGGCRGRPPIDPGDPSGPQPSTDAAAHKTPVRGGHRTGHETSCDDHHSAHHRLGSTHQVRAPARRRPPTADRRGQRRGDRGRRALAR